MQEPVHVSEQTKRGGVECGTTKISEESAIRMSVAGVYRRVATKSIGRADVPVYRRELLYVYSTGWDRADKVWWSWAR